MIVYEDAALVVVNKPAGLSSEEGVPAALRRLWSRPDAYVGIVHRLDTGVSGLMVCARTPRAAAALTRQVTESQQVYAVRDGRAEPGPGTPQQPCFIKKYRAVVAGAPDEQLPAAGLLRDYLFKDSRKGRVFPEPGRDHAAHRAHPSDPGAVCRPQTPIVGRWQIRQPVQRGDRSAKRRAVLCTPGNRGKDGIYTGCSGGRTLAPFPSPPVTETSCGSQRESPWHVGHGPAGCMKPVEHTTRIAPQQRAASGFR